jgi:hypothetical protein
MPSGIGGSEICFSEHLVVEDRSGTIDSLEGSCCLVLEALDPFSLLLLAPRQHSLLHGVQGHGLA